MATAQLSIDLVARLATLEANLGKAARVTEQKVSQMSGSFGKLSGQIQDVGKALGAYLGVEVVRQFVTAQVEALDALNDFSDATGTSVENASALEDIMRRTGGTLGDVQSVLIKFNGALNSADGKNEVSRALKAIGLDAEALRRMDPAEALMVVAKAFDGTANSGDKARISQTLFGKSVGEAAPLLADLAAAGELNATVTKEQAAQAEEFKKNLASLSTEIFNAGRAVMNELLPPLNSLIERFKAARREAVNGSLLDAILGTSNSQKLQATSDAASAALTRSRESIERMQAEFERGGGTDTFLAKRIEKAKARSLELAKAAAAASEQVKGFTNIMQASEDAQAAALKGQPEVAKKAAKAFGGGDGDKAKKKKDVFVGPELPEELKLAQAAIDAVDLSKAEELRQTLEGLLAIQSGGGGPEVAQAIDEVNKQLRDLDPLAKAAAEQKKRLDAMLEATPTAELAKARADMELLAQAFREGKISADLFNEAATARLGLVSDESKKAKDDLDEFIKEAQRSMQQELSSAFYAAFSGEFDSVGKGFQDLVLKMAADAAAANLGKLLFGDLSTGGGGNSGVIGQLIGQIISGSAGGGGSGTVTGATGDFSRMDRASGAKTTATASMQGVRVTPLKYDPSLEAGGKAGGNATVIVENRSGGEVREERSRDSNGDEYVRLIVERTKSAIETDMARGGRVSRSVSQAFGVKRQTPRVGR